ncbi:ankyrin and HET domain-containing protein [Colletotrichum sojae]|uniref:Ankyrin and HET domain-containing protein n=1 Tax=Colletotrichum sojae TaxID=2175907 RepID=A0A8H6JWF3_9PEZI|nr:ankyrin and HET domain-containing protein [Colletotrichum sojae]
MNDIYGPLPEGDYVRLLYCEPVGESNDLICELRARSLQECQQKYFAVSYAWEDPAPVDRLSLRDGRSLPLGKTLAALFDWLRKLGKAFNVWVDALCIDQQNVAERERQVALMRQVYSSATIVLVWLGPSDAGSEAAFRVMNSRRNFRWPADWDNAGGAALADLDVVLLFLARPWFQRTWVIQEFTLNCELGFMCGGDTVEYHVFHNALCAIWAYFEGLGDYPREHPAVRGLWNSTRMLFVRRQYQACGKVDFERLLEAAHHCEASDPRDMVFGFFGIADRNLPLPRPNYTASIEDVYLKTAEAVLLSDSTSLDLLALAGLARRTLPSALPTWVPDPRNRCFDEPIAARSRGRWTAGSHIPATVAKAGSRHLELCVQPIDVVAATCPPIDSRSVAQQKAAIGAVSALRPMLQGGTSASDEEWFDLLATNLIMGLDINDERAGPEYRGHFLEYVRWLESSTSEEDLCQIKHNRFYRTLGPRMDGWQFCFTRRGRLCMAPPEVRAGDEVCYVLGCRLPLVVRSTGRVHVHGEKALPEFVLVSWCFAHGLMYGEGFWQPARYIFLR